MFNYLRKNKKIIAKNIEESNKKILSGNQCMFKNKESMEKVFQKCNVDKQMVSKEELLPDGSIIITFTDKKHWSNILCFEDKIVISAAAPKHIKKYEYDETLFEIAYYDALYAKNAEEMIEKLEEKNIKKDDVVSIVPEYNILAAIVIKRINIRKEIYIARAEFSEFLLEHMVF